MSLTCHHVGFGISTSNNNLGIKTNVAFPQKLCWILCEYYLHKQFPFDT